jgi:hypothetical protein
MNQAQRTALTDPNWWRPEHSSAWERAKTALRRDWEQTKADFSDGGEELNQTAADTLRQAAGKEPIPPRGFANPAPAIRAPHDDWDTSEAAIRYGYGARQYYSGRDWSEDLEEQLRQEWATNPTNSSWAQVRHAVRRGWDGVQRGH